MADTCVWALEADTFSDVPTDGSLVLCGKEAIAYGLCVDHLAPVLSAEVGRERDALRAQVADLTARAETAEAKVAAVEAMLLDPLTDRAGYEHVPVDQLRAALDGEGTP